MGIFGRFKDAFSGRERPPEDDGIYLYIRLERGGEVVRLRLSPQHELVPNYDEGGYYTRKTIVGPRTFQRAEATFQFNPQRELIAWEISGGDIASEEDWQAELSSNEGGGAGFG
jgi:hypothetical protein